MANTKPKFVYSVLANDQTFPVYKKSEKSRSVNSYSDLIMIKGGANIVDKKTGSVPLVVETEVTTAQATALSDMVSFKKKADGGFLLISDKKLDTEEALEKLKGNDPSKQKTEKELKKTAESKGVKNVKITTSNDDEE